MTGRRITPQRCGGRQTAPRTAVLASLLLLLLLLWPAVPRAGTPGVDEPPPAQAPRPLVLPALHPSTLANGLSLVVAPRPGLPVVTVSLLVRAGPEADPPGRPGVAAMTATLWPKGALRAGKPVAAAELARSAEALGGGLDRDRKSTRLNSSHG